MHLCELIFIKDQDNRWYACIPDRGEVRVEILPDHSSIILRRELEDMGISPSNIYTIESELSARVGFRYDNLYVFFEDDADEAEFILKISAT
jgi:hypothetical protein